MRIRMLNLFVVFALTIHSTAFLRANGLGINLNLVERGGTYVDVIKEHHRWLDPDTWQPLASEDFDNKGWPIVDALLMMDERLVAEWASEVDDPDEYRLNLGGIYKGSFMGRADISSTGETEKQNVIYDSISNTTFFEWVAPEPTGSAPIRCLGIADDLLRAGEQFVVGQRGKRAPDDVLHVRLIQ